MRHAFWLRIGVIIIIVFIIISNSCHSAKSIHQAINMDNGYTNVSPKFDADSAYSYIKKQVSFGPRVPSTPQHIKCGDWLIQKLSQFGASIIEQKANVIHYDGQEIEIRNIIGSYNSEIKDRILLFAHWDTRPFADKEQEILLQKTPILGADDGASGVGVLLEIARQIQLKPPTVGIDIIFFDMEDWGEPEFSDKYIPGEWWCVGSRYWSEQPHIENYRAKYGILLDMVGAKDATFMLEGYSYKQAKKEVLNIWSTAAQLGYKQFFVKDYGGYITDDHVPIIENLNIPCINIINLKNDNHGFAPHWHTHNDNLSVIDKETLSAVGQTVLEVIYKE